MKMSNKLREKIERVFKNNQDIKNKLLAGDEDTIKKIGIKSQRGIPPEDVIECYENNTLDYLYKRAVKLKEMEEIYKELYKAVARNHIEER